MSGKDEKTDCCSFGFIGGFDVYVFRGCIRRQRLIYHRRSGDITIDDVTYIQKVLAELVTDTNGSITKRGNVDGDELSISDATAVQMYIAGFRNDDNIGGTAEEQVTTQAATQPTTRSYELPFIPVRR